MLFTPPSQAVRSELAAYKNCLESVMPLHGTHRKELPFAVHDLSRVLTTDRPDIRKGYWTAPRQLAAYVRYFLPWNLYRFSWLLPNLDLLPAEDVVAEPLILDIGCGPLTFAQALWISRPDLRTRRLRFVCSDVAPKPMELGLELLKNMAETSGTPFVWNVTLVREPLESVLRTYRGRVDLLLGANVLNELRPSKRQSPEQRLAAILRMLGGALRNANAGNGDRPAVAGGKALLIEPGTRQSGHTLSRVRDGLMAAGCAPLAPCPHYNTCPMHGDKNGMWCHVNLPSDFAPDWLMELSERARFEKRNVSLSFLFHEKIAVKREEATLESLAAEEAYKNELKNADARNTAKNAPVVEEMSDDFYDMDDDIWDEDDAIATVRVSFPPVDENAVRIITDAFPVPTNRGNSMSRYACSGHGLMLVQGAETLYPGSLISAKLPENMAKDAKSGALIVPPALRETPDVVWESATPRYGRREQGHEFTSNDKGAKNLRSERGERTERRGGDFARGERSERGGFGKFGKSDGRGERDSRFNRDERPSRERGERSASFRRDDERSGRSASPFRPENGERTGRSERTERGANFRRDNNSFDGAKRFDDKKRFDRDSNFSRDSRDFREKRDMRDRQSDEALGARQLERIARQMEENERQERNFRRPENGRPERQMERSGNATARRQPRADNFEQPERREGFGNTDRRNDFEGNKFERNSFARNSFGQGNATRGERGERSERRGGDFARGERQNFRGERGERQNFRSDGGNDFRRQDGARFPQREDRRPFNRESRSERPNRFDRDARPAHFDRSERPARQGHYDTGDFRERLARGEHSERRDTDRQGFDRRDNKFGARSERPEHGNFRSDRSDRPARSEYSDRPRSYGEHRDRNDAPRERSFDRPRRDSNRDGNYGEREQRGEDRRFPSSRKPYNK